MHQFADIELTATDYDSIAGRWPSCNYITDANPGTGQTFSRPAPHPAELLPHHFAYFADTMPPFADTALIERPLQLWLLENVCVTGYEGAVVFPNGAYEAGSMAFAPLHLAEANFRRNGASCVLKEPPTQTIDDFCFLGFRAGYDNYAHWMLEHTAYLVIYVRRFLDDGVRLLLPHRLPQYGKELVRFLGIPDAQIVWLDNGPVVLRKVVACSEASPPYQPSLLRESLHRVREAAPGEPAGSRITFVSRGDALYRPLLNEAELIDRLRGLGIETFVPGRHSLAEQARMFSGSRGIIGLHGAGMANVLFCREGNQVLELFPEYCLSDLFYTTASLCGLRYGYASGTSFSRDDAHLAAGQHASWSAPWVVDVDLIELLVRQMFF